MKVSKPPSIVAIAREAGVSHATVSMVLNPGPRGHAISVACAERIRSIADRLGYVPNHAAHVLKSGRAGAISMVIDVDPDDSNLAEDPESSLLGLPYFGVITGAVELFTRNRGCLLAIVGPGEGMRALERGIRGVKQRSFDGLIVPGAAVCPASRPLLAKMAMVPLVVIEYAQPSCYPVIDWDEEAAIGLLLGHLAKLGHRKLVFLGPAADCAREQKFLALAATMGLHGSTCRFTGVHAGFFAPTVAAATAALRQRLDAGNDPFTAVVAYNDVVAIGACAALRATGLRVPDDVSVVGFDNVVAALATPPLTTVSHRLHDIGLRAAEQLFAMIDTPDAPRPPSRTVVPPQLIVRASTGPAA